MTSSALPGARQAPRRSATRFLAIFGLVCGLGLSAAAGTLAVLQRQGLLPPPPVTATWCFNLKFAFLRGVPTLADTTLLAVGSSAAWRNLDLSVFARRWPGTALSTWPATRRVRGRWCTNLGRRLRRGRRWE